MRVIRDAAAGDPDMASQREANEQQGDISYRLLVQQLAERRALKIDLSADEAADRAFALLSVELHLLLTTTRGWTPDHWERWTSATLVETLLRH